ncbi:TRAP transporter permease [Thetidibacter halocola]|uniref:TRAP transporter fused permease subunit n=1 Tax=Thetidibacter halocola TaxID=2827239 RepID=A0A8J8BAA3_9RHOB|nr:TRAP transporter fused permease subunit [Thetidibacter halocola]MBS0124983.1 TRAP transporter fused permease subunit [Thetidibacter halocola]
MLRAIISASLPVLGILWLLDVPADLGWVIITEQYLAVICGIACLAGIVSSPLSPRLQALDWAFGLAAMVGWFWLALNYEAWLIDPINRGPEKWVPAIVAVLGALEATRRQCGTVLAALAVAFLAYGFFGWMAPGIFEAAYLAPVRYLLYIYNDTNGIPGLVLNVGATQILGFIIFGATLNVVGGSRAMTDLALALMGHRRGGPAKVAVIASSLFGTLSGSTVANVMSTGVVTIPMMKKSGFPPRYAAAIEAVASNGGQIAPPVMGATAFVIAEFLQVPYTDVVLAATLPAFFYYFLLYRMIDRYAAAHGLAGEPREALPKLRTALLGAWPLIAPIAILIWFLFYLGYSPGKAALYSAGAAFALFAVTDPRGALAALPEILRNSGQTLLPILLVCAVAGIVIGTINISGLGFALTLALGKIASLGGVFPLLLATAVIAIVLGVGMPTTGVYVIVSVLLAPALVREGIGEMSAHLFILYFGLLSMLTPPVAVASYAAASIAGSDMWQTGISGMRLAIVAYLLPFVFALNPALLMDGTWLQIGISCLTIAVAGSLLAEGLASKRAYGGGAMRLLAIASALIIGASTAVFAPDSVPGISIALLSVPVAWALTRIGAPSQPTSKEPAR